MPAVIRKPAVRPNSNTKTPEEERFYNSYAWQRARNAHRHLEPLCRECAKVDVITAADMVDHIVRIRDGGDPLNDSNLQSLCNACHNRKRQAESLPSRR